MSNHFLKMVLEDELDGGGHACWIMDRADKLEGENE